MGGWHGGRICPYSILGRICPYSKGDEVGLGANVTPPLGANVTPSFCVAGAIVSEPQKDFFHPSE